MSETEEKPKVANAVVVKFDKDGAPQFADHTELSIVAQYMISIRAVPEHLKTEGLEAVKSALQLCRQLSLPDRCMNEMAYVKGKLTCFGSLVTALAERAPNYGEKKEFFVDEEGNEICVKNKNLKAKVWAAVCQIKKKGDSEWSEYVFSVDDAFTAGLLTDKTKPDSGWIKYMKDMLMHKARARGLRSNYASALNGINYLEDIQEALEWRSAKDVTPKTESMMNPSAFEKFAEEGGPDEHSDDRGEVVQ